MEKKNFRSLLLVFIVLLFGSVLTANTKAPMVLVYDTTLSSGREVSLPLQGITSVTVNWGDGSSDYYTTEAMVGHIYNTNGTYTVTISGSMTWFGGRGVDSKNLVKVTNFGDLGITSFNGAFSDAINLVEVPKTLPSNVISISGMFAGATSFNYDIGSWDVGQVEEFSYMFAYASLFNKDIGSWDTGSAINMEKMFYKATSFNQDIGYWDVSNVASMSSMFEDATSFDQNIGNWDVSSVTDFEDMFEGIALSVSNYNSLLTGWATLTLKNNKWFNAGNSRYSLGYPQVAHDYIVNTYLWRISDGYVIMVNNPSTFNANGASISEIDLSWTKNSNNDKVLVAWNSTNSLGSPSYGTNYSVGDTIPGGGTVIYYGNNLSYNHTGLLKNTKYYYKVWSYCDSLSSYSAGVVDSSATYGGTKPVGNGTEINPYKIANLDNLLWLSTATNSWNSHFIQTADIDASATTGWNNGAGFSPIGDSTNYFKGSYNGQYHKIDNLYINRNSENYIGLFGCATKDTTIYEISNLGLTNVNITGNRNVGALTGENFRINIKNCYATGVVNGECSGGLIGICAYGSIDRCFANVSVNSRKKIVGGLIGSTGDSLNVYDCYALGNVSGDDQVGGVIGYNLFGDVKNCYATGTITSNQSNYGGLVGYNYAGTVYNSFWDITTSGLSTTNGGGTGKTSSEMKKVVTFTDISTTGLYSPWDFVNNPNDDTDNNNYWKISNKNNDGYPYLSWQKFTWEKKIYITEISDNKAGQAENTGFIELWNNTGLAANLSDYTLFRGTNPTGNAFVQGAYSYTFPEGTSLAENGVMIVTNGCTDINTFETVWNVSLESMQFVVGSDSLDITNGWAYAINKTSKEIVDFTPEVQTNDRLEQSEVDSWSNSSPDSGTPGDFDGDAPLPVTLSSFTGYFNNGSTILQWTTQSETNNSYWNIYRSETKDFENSNKINNQGIAGGGTSSNAINYEFEDNFGVDFGKTYYYWIESIDLGGSTMLFNPISIVIPEQNDNPDVPSSIIYGLHQNYPNPFNPSTEISFALKKAGNVSLVIYNLKGERVKTLVNDEYFDKDRLNTIVWNGTNDDNKMTSSGIYFYKLVANDKIYIKKMLLTK